MPTNASASAIYDGGVMHRRLSPRSHAFRYRVFALLLDLDELSSLSRLRFFSWNRPGIASFHERDVMPRSYDLVPHRSQITVIRRERGEQRRTVLMTHLRKRSRQIKLRTTLTTLNENLRLNITHHLTKKRIRAREILIAPIDQVIRQRPVFRFQLYLEPVQVLDTRAIDNFIVRLRRYIESNPSKPRHLVTVRGVGYRFLANPDVQEEG